MVDKRGAFIVDICLLFLICLEYGHSQVIFDDEPPRSSDPLPTGSTNQNQQVNERRPQFGFQNQNLNGFLQQSFQQGLQGFQQLVNQFQAQNGQNFGNNGNAQFQNPPRNEGFFDYDDEPNCRTYRNTGGFCIGLNLCESLSISLKNRPPHIINRIIRRSICGYSRSNSNPLVCCPEPPRQREFPTTRPTPPTRPINPRPPFQPVTTQGTTTTAPIQLIPVKPSQTTNPFQEIDGPVTLVPPRPTSIPPPNLITPVPNINNPIDDPDIRTGCGFSNASHSRIVGGRDAQKGAWPWVAAIGYRDSTGSVDYLCGGALISAQHVLTAGHCVHGRNDLKLVRLGDHDLFTDADGTTPINVEVDRIIPNPDYNPTTFQNDIAIIRLKRPVPFTLQVHPICLPSTPDLRNSRFSNKMPFVAGWGAIQFNGPSSSTLREVQVPVVDDSICQEKYKSFKNVHVDDSNICAGYQNGGKDACQGDSGGPLMQPVGANKYAIIGVVSFGFKCAEAGFPGVYSRVTNHLDWISDTIRNT